MKNKFGILLCFFGIHKYKRLEFMWKRFDYCEKCKIKIKSWNLMGEYNVGFFEHPYKELRKMIKNNQVKNNNFKFKNSDNL